MVTTDVEFDASAYSLEALHVAAYRLLGTASCQIEQLDQKYVCRLTLNSPAADMETTRIRFLDLVTDESVRERLSEKTEPIRNLILSLAFGSLAADQHK